MLQVMLSLFSNSAQGSTLLMKGVCWLQGAAKPPMEPELITSKFGFVENAEVINSRAAMVSTAF